MIERRIKNPRNILWFTKPHLVPSPFPSVSFPTQLIMTLLCTAQVAETLVRNLPSPEASLLIPSDDKSLLAQRAASAEKGTGSDISLESRVSAICSHPLRIIFDIALLIALCFFSYSYLRFSLHCLAKVIQGALVTVI